MQLKLPSLHDATGSLVIERNELAGRRWRLEARICQNPVCQCENVGLHCFPDTTTQSETEPLSPVLLEMGLTEREITNLDQLKSSPAAVLLANAVADEIGEEDWKSLTDLYFAVKQDSTERADSKDIHAQFPPQVLAGDGSMVGYHEILPYAKPIELRFNSETWWVDDQYCVNPKCSCQEAALSFFRSPSETIPAPVKPGGTVRYTYGTGQMEPVSDDGEAPSGQQLLNALERIQPDMNAYLAKRHALLRRLYRQALERKTVRSPMRKTGRNDPCPCGSGKKFKKCCEA